jgi:hypothetical protein
VQIGRGDLGTDPLERVKPGILEHDVNGDYDQAMKDFRDAVKALALLY